MENIINISKGYKAVLLPKDAENIELKTECGLWYRSGSNEYHMLGIPYGEIIGELNNLTEDQAREIVSSLRMITGNKRKIYTSSLEILKDSISNLGIQTENPLKEPKYDYPPAIRAWEASERECKTILIIKCKEE